MCAVFKQKCKCCHGLKQCVKVDGVRKCSSCLTPEDKAWLYEQKKAKAKQYKKTIDANKRANYAPTGEGDFFNILAKDRPHVCYITGTPITGGIKPINCLHVLPKGQYPAWRLNPRNIVFAQAQCHVDEHSQPRSVLEGRPDPEGSGWKRYFDLQRKLKEEYNGTGKEFKFESGGMTYTVKAKDQEELNKFLDEIGA